MKLNVKRLFLAVRKAWNLRDSCIQLWNGAHTLSVKKDNAFAKSHIGYSYILPKGLTSHRSSQPPGSGPPQQRFMHILRNPRPTSNSGSRQTIWYYVPYVCTPHPRMSVRNAIHNYIHQYHPTTAEHSVAPPLPTVVPTPCALTTGMASQNQGRSQLTGEPRGVSPGEASLQRPARHHITSHHTPLCVPFCLPISSASSIQQLALSGGDRLPWLPCEPARERRSTGGGRVAACYDARGVMLGQTVSVVRPATMAAAAGVN